MASERQAPDAYITQTNLDGTIADIDEDPDSPDANWADAVDHGADTVAHVSFPTPTGNPTAGADLQEFKIWIKRSRDKSNQPDCRIDLYENGVLITTGTLATVTSTTGELKSFTWDATNLTNADGSGVECYIFGDASGGNPANRESVSVGAVEWNVTYTVGGTSYSITASNGSYSIAGAAASLPIDRVMGAAGGSYALAGSTVNLLRDLLISAAGGSYAVTGTAAGLLYGKIMVAGSGSYAITGSDVSLPVSLSIPAGAGSYVLTGAATGLFRDLVMQALGSSYTVTGQTVGLTRDIVMAAEGGSYLLSGTAVGLEEGGGDEHGRGAQVSIFIWWD